jgi:hypothetical protein
MRWAAVRLFAASLSRVACSFLQHAGGGDGIAADSARLSGWDHALPQSRTNRPN